MIIKFVWLTCILNTILRPMEILLCVAEALNKFLVIWPFLKFSAAHPVSMPCVMCSGGERKESCFFVIAKYGDIFAIILDKLGTKFVLDLSA